MDLKGNKLKFDTFFHYLLIDPTSIIPTPLNFGLILPNIRLIHYTMDHVLLPKKSNYNTIQISDIHVVEFLENQVPKDWADVVLHHMLDSKMKNNTLPYVELITKILNCYGYDFV